MGETRPLSIVVDDRFLDHHTYEDDHPEVPARVLVIRDRLRKSRLAEYLTEVAPREAERRWITTIHEEAYLARFEEAALSGQPFLNHPDNQICYESYQTAVLAAGSGLTGIDLIEAGDCATVFCCTRPPGHHAEHATAMGFCFLNNAAIAARYWQQAYGRARILVIDWDAHHGNGIQNAFLQDANVLYVSIHEHPTFSFPGTGLSEETGIGPGDGATVNIPLPSGAGDAMVLRALSARVEPAVARFRPDALIVAAGFDGHHWDDMSGLSYSTGLYGYLGRTAVDWGRRFCQGRVLSILEGGYHLEALADSVETYLTALIGHENTPSEGGSPCT